MNKIELGSKVKDRISGFEGVATVIADYLNGCRRVGITPKCDDKGNTRDTEWFDIQQIDVLEVGAVTLDAMETGGGPDAPPM